MILVYVLCKHVGVVYMHLPINLLPGEEATQCHVCSVYLLIKLSLVWDKVRSTEDPMRIELPDSGLQA